MPTGSQMGIERRIGGVAEMHHQQGVAVGHSTGNPGRSKRAAGAGQVLDEELSAENLVDSLRRDACDHVTRTARRVGHHHHHRSAAGIVLRHRIRGEETPYGGDRIENSRH